MPDSQPTPGTKPIYGGIDKPVAGGAYLVSGYDDMTNSGKMEVIITKTVQDTVDIYADIFSIDADLPAMPTATKVNIPQRAGSNSIYEKLDFSVTNLPNQIVSVSDEKSNNRFIYYWGFDNTGAVTEEGHAQFRAVPETCTGTVLATHCLWFTYETSANKLPKYGEYGGTGSPYVPFGARVPAEANSITITASGTWAHGDVSAYSSDPNGRTGQTYNLYGEAKDEYLGLNGASSIKEQSDGIELGKLVGLREYPNSGTSTDELPIGDSATVCLNIGNDRAYMIRLGLHDGYEWSNNTGSMSVTIEWAK